MFRVRGGALYAPVAATRGAQLAMAVRGFHATLSVRAATKARSASTGAKAKAAEPVAEDKASDSAPKPAKDGCKIVVVTSGKGGVGKTTTSASFSTGLANAGFRTCVIDFDIGLRNLDLHLGMERRVVYDFVNVINGDASLGQALIKDRRNDKLSLLAASQTRDKSALTMEGVERVLTELKTKFDYIVCDSPAGIEQGAQLAMYFADEAVVCTNPELSSVRDSDKMIGLLTSKSKRAIEGSAPMKIQLLITRYQPVRVADANMLSVDDITEMLGIPLLGVIPESEQVLISTNLGQPVILSQSDCAGAYSDFVRRFQGESLPLRFTNYKPKGIFARLFG